VVVFLIFFTMCCSDFRCYWTIYEYFYLDY